ncbi:Recombination protein RecR [hydrothermal vent metagenome]|uniref:Recombination protein RecR n=1 Tax=hydrothermal vent metagenome TaxID=652676 RepID=A0A3B0VK99_9ZZZZ
MSLLSQLMNALQILPGVGPKSAQRICFNLLQKNKDKAVKLAAILNQACEQIGECQRCRTLTENDICKICLSDKRNPSQLCIVETPADLMQIEQATDYSGTYFVLHGHLSPLDGLGPDELGFPKLVDILAKEPINEVIMATNSTLEGQTTAQYIAQMCSKAKIKATGLAHGVPLGGELEYVDANTIAHAFGGREVL